MMLMAGLVFKVHFLILFHSPLYIALWAGVLSALGTWTLLPVLRRFVMDMPNPRSNHKAPVPRGGGIAMIAAMLLALTVAGVPVYVLIAAALLAIVSFVDDIRGLGAGIRLVAQVVTVAVALYALPGRIFPSFIPLPVEYIILAIAWIWFINLTNFMDGIDGISAMEAVMVSAGICIMHALYPWIGQQLATSAAVIASCAYGFYIFNRSPPKVFMGDVGSIPLGFLMGYLLIVLASNGYLLPALILPAYYVGDATYTLIARQLRGQKVWQAHSEHAYQQAVRLGLTHKQVVTRISWLNGVLIVLAMCASLSIMAGVASLIVAYGLTFWLMYHFFHATPA